MILFVNKIKIKLKQKRIILDCDPSYKIESTIYKKS